MDLVKQITIISVLVVTKIEMKPFSSLSIPDLFNSIEKERTVLRLPKDINSGTNITIQGYSYNVGITTFTGDHMEKQDECTIVFARHTRKDELLLRIENQNQSTERTYEIDPRNKEVNFTLHVLANVVKAEASMDVHFEESDRGPEFIGTCTFKSFKPLEYIVIKGVEHVQNLNFNFKRE